MNPQPQAEVALPTPLVATWPKSFELGLASAIGCVVSVLLAIVGDMVLMGFTIWGSFDFHYYYYSTLGADIAAMTSLVGGIVQRYFLTRRGWRRPLPLWLLVLCWSGLPLFLEVMRTQLFIWDADALLLKGHALIILCLGPLGWLLVDRHHLRPNPCTRR